MTMCDTTNNSALLWNGFSFWDPLNETHNLGDAPVQLHFSAILSCGSSYSLEWTLLLDTDNDGHQEFALRAGDNIAAGYFPIGNVLLPSGSYFDSLLFDNRMVSGSEKFRFALEEALSGDTLTARLRWHTDQAPGVYQDPELPLGTHTLMWVLSRGAERDTCTQVFRVIDCGAPKVTCIADLSMGIQPGNPPSSTLWAQDVLQKVQDNYSFGDQNQLSFRINGTGTGFPVDSLGNPVYQIKFTCMHLGEQLLDLWARDRSGNTDSCQMRIFIRSNGFCDTPMPWYPEICVEPVCKPGKDLPGVNVTLSGGAPGPPPVLSEQEGCFYFPPDLPFLPYKIDFLKNDDPLKGVSAYDVVLISRHIQGSSPLDDPYVKIAADVNRSGAISSFDLVELRKVILGVYTVFPNNTSWRFVDAAFVFPNPQNPFQTTFPESLDINMPFLPPQKMYGIKVGDVNCSNILNYLSGEAEVRGAESLLLPDMQLEAGNVVKVPVFLPPAHPWFGAQLAFRFDPEVLEILDVQSALSPEFWDVHTPTSGTWRFVWAQGSEAAFRPGDPLLTLHVRSKAPARLSDALRLDRDVLRPEVYGSDGIHSLQTAFLPNSDPVPAPWPNPASDLLRFPVPAITQGDAALRVWDAQGKTVYAGNLSASDYPAWVDVSVGHWETGVYVWQWLTSEGVYSGQVVKE